MPTAASSCALSLARSSAFSSLGAALEEDVGAGLGWPLAPGATMPVTYDLGIENRGFVNNGSRNEIAYNGTFFNSDDFFPHLGYTRRVELDDPNERRRRDLPPVQRFPKIDDTAARADNYLSSEADWVQFATTVSTSPDQIAIAPGYLKREWTENGRHYFRYEMDAPIFDFFAYLSARYAVKRDHWNDVAIEVDYHPDHPYNVDRMIAAVKKSLDYFTTQFGPYQHHQVRIVGGKRRQVRRLWRRQRLGLGRRRLRAAAARRRLGLGRRRARIAATVDGGRALDGAMQWADLDGNRRRWPRQARTEDQQRHQEAVRGRRDRQRADHLIAARHPYWSTPTVPIEPFIR